MRSLPTARRRPGRTCIDLFSGAGGLAVGFRQAGWSVLAANDADKHAGETFKLNFPEAVFFEGPIASLTPKALMKACGLKRGELDCLIGGPPCQSFSYNNHQRSAGDDRARLFECYLRLVEGLNPKTLVMENVPGIKTIDNGTVVAEIEKRLSALGFSSHIETLSSEKFGTPQIRRRVFIVATRLGGGAAGLFPTAKKKGRPVRVRQAIGDLPKLASGGGDHVTSRSKVHATTMFQRNIRDGARKLYNHVCHALTELTLKRVAFVPEGGNWRDIPRNFLPKGMQRARKSDHTKRYGRLSRDGFASTILTKCDPHWGAYIHPTQHRTISVREAARLQGFPDSFRFAGDHVSKQYEQVGNAVPVIVARAIGEEVLSHIRKRGTALRNKVIKRRAVAKVSRKEPKSQLWRTLRQGRQPASHVAR